jgi:hypothetical protein
MIRAVARVKVKGILGRSAGTLTRYNVQFVSGLGNLSASIGIATLHWEELKVFDPNAVKCGEVLF